ISVGHCPGSGPLAGLQHGGIWERAGVRERSLLGEGHRTARRRAEPGAPPCGGCGHIFSEIGTVDPGKWELGPLLAGRGPGGVGARIMEAAGPITTAAIAVDSAGFLRVFDRLRLRAASCPDLVALCHF